MPRSIRATSPAWPCCVRSACVRRPITARACGSGASGPMTRFSPCWTTSGARNRQADLITVKLYRSSRGRPNPVSSNSFGKLLTVTTFGESHGPAIGCVVDGCPPGLEIAAEEFRHDLERRATGRSRYTSQRHEADEVEILSGVYARETTMRVAAAVIAKKWLAEHHGVCVRGWLAQVGDITPDAFDWNAVERNPFFWPDAAQVPALENYINALRKSGDSVGARVNVVADGVPPGWGEPIYGKLDGDLASALMSINAVKGVEIGDGFAAVAQRGSQHRDEMHMDGFTSNHAGGILGGISSGQPVTASIVLKPTSSILIPGHSVNLAGEQVDVVTKGRHDPCVGIRATPIAEAMMALVLMDHALRHRAQCGDVGPVAPRIA